MRASARPFVPAVSVRWRERVGDSSQDRCIYIRKSKSSCSLFKNEVYVSVLYGHFYRQRNLPYVWNYMLHNNKLGLIEGAKGVCSLQRGSGGAAD